MRKYLARGHNKGEQGKEPVPAADNAEEKDDAFPTPTGALMIFGGSTVYDSKRHQKLTRREVYTAGPATPAFLRWSESAITFDRTDHPDAVPHLGRYPLVVDPIVGPKRLTKVLMDGAAASTSCTPKRSMRWASTERTSIPSEHLSMASYLVGRPCHWGRSICPSLLGIGPITGLRPSPSTLFGSWELSMPS